MKFKLSGALFEHEAPTKWGFKVASAHEHDYHGPYSSRSQAEEYAKASLKGLHGGHPEKYVDIIPWDSDGGWGDPVKRLTK